MKACWFVVAILWHCLLVSEVYAAGCVGWEARIDSLLEGERATVGIAVMAEGQSDILYNNEWHYPLFSVFKFHVALAVLDKMDREGTGLDSLLHISASSLLENTYSPLRQKFPDCDLDISLGELLRYSISLSDNNACDILIEYAGGMEYVDGYIRRLGISAFNLSETEALMHLAPENARRNWSTPLEVVRLLKIAFEKQLFAREYKDFLWQVMTETSTGPDKIKGLLPKEVTVGHKTGSSDRTPEGMKAGDNDAGIVCLPDGRKYYIAVFVMDSYETDEVNASIIARISRMVYEELLRCDWQ